MSYALNKAQGPSAEITSLLAEVVRGNKDAEGRLYALLYTQLHRLARSYMRRERPGHTLQPSALLNEAYVRLVGMKAGWRSRGQFMATAAHLMRTILVDHARSRNAGKRGGGAGKISLEDELAYSEGDCWQVIAVHEALTKLAQWDQRQCRIVELRFFAGLNTEETAKILGLSSATIKREFQVAKAWLYGELSKPAA
jgi:RNA polymerase sigma factor (TIGR02999 family)